MNNENSTSLIGQYGEWAASLIEKKTSIAFPFGMGILKM